MSLKGYYPVVLGSEMLMIGLVARVLPNATLIFDNLIC